jgi:protein gp37
MCGVPRNGLLTPQNRVSNLQTPPSITWTRYSARSGPTPCARFADQALKPVEREAFIVEEMCQALKDMGGKFVLPFRFHNRRGTRVTHHLFFVTKHFKGYALMKDIMRAHATGRHDGPVNFEYNPADRRQPTLYELLLPVEDLGEMILNDLAGWTAGIEEIYERHSVGKPYVLKDYREQLCKLEQEEKVVMSEPCPPRRKGTLAPRVRITIPMKNLHMSIISTIEWTDATWNPVRGCTKISPGCKHCYAETFAERFRGVPGHPYEQGFDLRLVPQKLSEPLKWAAPKTIFVNSMSDLFQRGIPARFVEHVVRVMAMADWHTYQVLTKRADHMRDMLKGPLVFAASLDHIWWGVSVEDRKYGVPRIDALREAPAGLRFLSVEPLLEDLGEIDLAGIHWVIVGGESGLGARPMKKEWVIKIREQCDSVGVPFFFKQWGGVRKSETGRILEGRTYDAMPERRPRKVAENRERLGMIEQVREWASEFEPTVSPGKEAPDRQTLLF